MVTSGPSTLVSPVDGLVNCTSIAVIHFSKGRPLFRGRIGPDHRILYPLGGLVIISLGTLHGVTLLSPFDAF